MSYKIVENPKPNWQAPWVVEEYDGNTKKKEYEVITINPWTYMCTGCQKTNCVHINDINNYFMIKLGLNNTY